MRVWFLLLVLVAAKNYCDDDYYCDNGETCCKFEGEFTCCPETGAVCCEGGDYCCPGDKPVCDIENKACEPETTKQFRLFSNLT
jgi:hypothetical protein